uniref:Subtilase-like protein n=1 Tax=Oryza sativa subsp. japonica TaxID=39947 RepID=Q5VN75_ORYSJ|nr:subtilase-like protein [Oryza sativa Japonica Group]
MEMAAGMEVAARLTTAGGSGGEAGDGGRIRRCRPFWPPVAAVLRWRLLASVVGDSGSGDDGRLATAVTEEAAATSAVEAGKESVVR